MPPVVSESVDEILTKLENVLKLKAPQLLESLQPGLSAQEIAELERRAGVQLPDDLKALYRWRNGSSREGMKSRGRLPGVPIPNHWFMPLAEALGVRVESSNQVAQATMPQKGAFAIFAGHRKSWVTLFDDGSGDGYFFDPKRQAPQGAVFYCFSEDASYVFFPSIKNLLAGVVKCYEKEAFTLKGGSLNDNFELSMKIWNEFGRSKDQ